MSQDKLLFLLVTIISLVAITSFAMSPFFNLENIEYNGLDLIKTKDISHYINNYVNSNLFLVDQRQIENTLMNNSLIKEVHVEKKYPDSILINIREREPIASIRNFDQILIFTADGFIINKELDIRVPEIKGLAYSIYMDKLEFSNLLAEIVHALENVDMDIRTSFSSIRYDEEEKSLIIYRNSMPIFLGNSNSLEEKFRVLESLIYKADEELMEIEYIDLRLLNRPVIKRK